MPNSDILYVRGMNLSETEEEEVDEQKIWDDSRLSHAYDKALKIANAEVARRLAMSTNTQNSKDDSKSKEKPQTSAKTHKKENKSQWKVGMHCRAVYEGDGIEYEASLMRIINDKECVVKFLGYENSEIVPINALKPSLGKTIRTQQIEVALAENLGEGYSNHVHGEDMECSDRPPSPGSTVSLKKKKKSKKKNNPKQMNGFDFPEIPRIPMPNFAHLKNLGAMDMPIPPPPPITLSRSETESEEQAVSSMLLSWYMSGYYTGLYQGMKRSSREGRKH